MAESSMNPIVGLITVSKHWDKRNKKCKKHNVNGLPCLQCFAEKDPDIRVEVTPEFKQRLEAKNDEARAIIQEPGLDIEEYDDMKVIDFFPEEHRGWIEERIVYL